MIESDFDCCTYGRELCNSRFVTHQFTRYSHLLY